MAKKRTLNISSHRGQWRNRSRGEPSGADKGFQRVKPDVLIRDGNTCVYCGLQLEGKGIGGASMLEVHHLDCNHENNEKDNLVTTDHFCHAYNHIGFLGKMGTLAYIPEISIEDCNHLVRTIGIAMLSTDPEMKQIAKHIYSLLMAESDAFALVWGTKNPADIGNALLAVPEPVYNSRVYTLKGVKVLYDLTNPVNQRFVENVYNKKCKDLPFKDWAGLAKQYLEEDEGSFRKASESFFGGSPDDFGKEGEDE